jgi:hypothetical protein
MCPNKSHYLKMQMLSEIMKVLFKFSLAIWKSLDPLLLAVKPYMISLQERNIEHPKYG